MEREWLEFASEKLMELLRSDDERDVATVTEGMNLFYQGAVEVTGTDKEVVFAEVYDVHRHEVEMHLLYPQLWRCPCDAPFLCRHQMAVFFSLYSDFFSVMEWIEEWKSRKRPALPKDLNIKRASEVFASQRKENAVLEKSYLAYKEFVANAFAEKIEHRLMVPGYVMEGQIEEYLTYIGKKAPIEREWKLIYRFTTLFFTLMHTIQILRLHQKQAHTVRVFYAFATDLLEELYENISPLSRQVRPFAFDDFVENLKDDIGKLLIGEQLLEYDCMDLYRELWNVLFVQSSWRKEELKRMTEERDALYPETKERTIYTIAVTHLLLLENRDEEAAAQLSELGADSVPYFFYWINGLSDKRGIPFIEFAIRYIREFLPKLGDYYARVDFVRTFTRPINSWCTKYNRMDLLDKFYRATLPHSYWNYASFLFEQKQYKKWVEMHIYSEIGIDMINSELIKKITAEEPELVLPLYFHAVQEKVSLKNRSAYKSAIRYLKKMRTIYKKVKKEETFERYLVYVQDSTKRLRAFQEELKRSKLIDV